MKKLLGIDVTDEEFDRLLCEQSKGKEIKIVGGKPVAMEHEVTEEEQKQTRIYEIKNRLNELSQDFVQMQLGANFGTMVLEDGTEIDVAEQRKTEFQTLHNELRQILGKEPREYKNY